MANTLVASLPKFRYDALAFRGIMVYESYPQIRDMLSRKFGGKLDLLLARPVVNSDGGMIDWYSEAEGTPRKLTELDPAERARIASGIETASKSILEFADTLVNSGDPLKTTRGSVLKRALLYPDESCLYAVGDQPTVVCWGFGPAGTLAEPLALYGSAETASGLPQAKDVSVAETPESKPMPKAVAADVVTPAEVGKGCHFCWLWWVLPLLAAILLFFALFSSFGSIGAYSGVSLLAGPALPFLNDPADAKSRNDKLEAELADLRNRLSSHAELCKPEPKIETPAARQLTIPQKTTDVRFLEGEWLCETGLQSARKREPVKFSFSFDDGGQGSGVVFEKDDTCRGEAKAELKDGVLRLGLGEQKCERSGVSYRPVNIECKNAYNGATICEGVNADGSSWDAEFVKIR